MSKHRRRRDLFTQNPDFPAWTDDTFHGQWRASEAHYAEAMRQTQHEGLALVHPGMPSRFDPLLLHERARHNTSGTWYVGTQEESYEYDYHSKIRGLLRLQGHRVCDLLQPSRALHLGKARSRRTLAARSMIARCTTTAAAAARSLRRPPEYASLGSATQTPTSCSTAKRLEPQRNKAASRS